MPLQGLARVRAEKAQAIAQTFSPHFGLLKMRLQKASQLVINALGAGHARQRFEKLLLRMEKVAQLLYQKLPYWRPLVKARAFRVDGGIAFRELDRGLRIMGDFDGLRVVSFIPGTACIDLAMVALTGRIR